MDPTRSLWTISCEPSLIRLAIDPRISPSSRESIDRSVSGLTGRVKEVKLMHLVLESEDGAKEILIPSGNVVTQIIQKMKPS